MTSLEDKLLAHAGVIGLVYAVIVSLGLIADFVLLVRARTHGLHWAERKAWLQWRPWFGMEMAGLLIVLAALQLLLVPLKPWIDRLMESPIIQPDSWLMLIQSIVLHWAGFIFVAAWLAYRRIRWSSAFGIRSGGLFLRFAQGVVFLVATMPILLFYTLIYHIGLQLTGYNTDLQDVAYAISDEQSLWMKAYFVVFAVVVAPVFEEILFRGIGLTVLAKRFGVATSIALISAAFALIHGHVPSLVPLFLLSVSFSLAYMFTGSLLVPMVMHGLFNGLTMAMILLAS